MKKLILILLIYFALTSSAHGQELALMIIGSGVVPPAFSCSTVHLIDECFDGTNECAATYTSNCNTAADSWIVGTGTPDFASLTPLDGGTYSMYLASSGTTNNYVGIIVSPSQGEIWVHLFYRPDTIPNDMREFCRLASADGTARTYVSLYSNGKVYIKNGTAAEQSTVAAMSADTTYHVWIYYKKGTGSDGVYSVAFSETGTEPTSGDNFSGNTNGTSTVNIERVRFYAKYSGTNQHAAWFDKIIIDDALIGNDP